MPKVLPAPLAPGQVATLGRGDSRIANPCLKSLSTVPSRLAASPSRRRYHHRRARMGRGRLFTLDAGTGRSVWLVLQRQLASGRITVHCIMTIPIVIRMRRQFASVQILASSSRTALRHHALSTYRFEARRDPAKIAKRTRSTPRRNFRCSSANS